ncbi:metallophosphoesterase [Synergistaceae bacterium OttesenSCG-928-D05]|nr:metallophosphoesterase [Synergistaceae bacterium OttesenSCG-928-D05]
MWRFFFQYGLIVYCIANVWIVWWFWRALRGKNFLRIFFCIALIAIMCGFPLFFRHPGISMPELVMLRIGSVWIGTFLYLFPIILLADLLSLIRTISHRVKHPYTKRSHSYCAFRCVFLLALIIAACGFLNASFPRINEITITAEVENTEHLHLPDNTLTIAAISDVHLGRLVDADFLSDSLERIVRYKPDVLFVLGDLIDDRLLLDREKIAGAFAQIQPRFGIWGILGNHEYISGEADGAIELMRNAGIQLLRDETSILGDSVLVIGRDDYSKSRFTGEARATLRSIIEKVPEAQKSLPVIVLDHQPRNLRDAEEIGAVLQLSGHTHNGQLWPFNYVVERVYENARGFSKRGDTNYFVTIGAGTWGPRVRNNARPEVVLIRLKFEEKNAD